MIDKDRSITAKSISKNLLNFYAFRWLCDWVGPQNTAVCLLVKSRPVHSGALQLACKFMTKLRWKPTDRRGTRCCECHCHGLIHNLLSVAQTAVSQQHQLNSRTAAFKNTAELNRALMAAAAAELTNWMTKHSQCPSTILDWFKIFYCQLRQSHERKSLKLSSKPTLGNKKPHIIQIQHCLISLKYATSVSLIRQEEKLHPPAAGGEAAQSLQCLLAWKNCLCWNTSGSLFFLNTTEVLFIHKVTYL